MCICLVTEEMEASDVSHHVDAGTGIKPWSSKRAVSALTSSATSQFLTGLQETSTAADYYPLRYHQFWIFRNPFCFQSLHKPGSLISLHYLPSVLWSTLIHLSWCFSGVPVCGKWGRDIREGCENKQKRLFVPMWINHARLSVGHSIILYLYIYDSKVISSLLSSWSWDLSISNQMTYRHKN